MTSDLSYDHTWYHAVGGREKKKDEYNKWDEKSGIHLVYVEN